MELEGIKLTNDLELLDKYLKLHEAYTFLFLQLEDCRKTSERLNRELQESQKKEYTIELIPIELWR